MKKLETASQEIYNDLKSNQKLKLGTKQIYKYIKKNNLNPNKENVWYIRLILLEKKGIIAIIKGVKKYLSYEG